MSVTQLQGQIGPLLVAPIGNLSELGPGRRHGNMFIGHIGQKQILEWLFAKGAQIVWLGAIFDASQQVILEKDASRTFETQLIVIIDVAAEAKQAHLVGLGRTKSGIPQQVAPRCRGQMQLGRGHVEVDATVVFGAQQIRYKTKVAIVFDLRADGDLRQIVILIKYGVASDPPFDADNLLLDRLPGNRAAQAERLFGIADLDTIIKADCDTRAAQVKIVDGEIGDKGRGGDEFAVLFNDENADGAMAMGERLLRALEAPIVIALQPVDVRASIGIAVFPEHGDDAATLLRHADIALSQAKKTKTGHALFDPRLAEQGLERLSLLGELRQAVEQDQLMMYYQPKIDLKGTGELHAEALVRWQHPARGFVPPMEFIPFAEQTGYIKAITLWVLNNSIAQCAAWRREGLAVNFSINLSTRDLLNPDLSPRLEQMLAKHACKSEWLTLEITESAIIDDPDHAMKNLDRLHALGFRLSIDDFGTGYSSLSYLKRLPVDELKIDKSFVFGMVKDSDDRVIVRSTIDLAHNMGLKVVAEGVENQEILDALSELGCDVAQGYLIS